MLDLKVLSVFAVPLRASTQYVGAVDLFRHRTGPLTTTELEATVIVAELAARPILDILGQDHHAAVNDPDSDAWAALNRLMRVDINRATGMLMARHGIGAPEALMRLRAHAYHRGRSTTAIAQDILTGRLSLDNA